MKTIILKYKHLWLILSLWMILGIVFQPAAYAAVLLSLIIFTSKEKYIELFIGFLFILLLSDHVHWGTGDPTQFAKDLKNIYLLALIFLLFRQRKVFDFSNQIFKFLLPFFILSFISLIWAIDLQIGIQKTLSYMLLYFTIPIYFLSTYKSKGKEFVQVVISYFLLVLAIGIILKFLYPNAVGSIEGRYSGLMGNPNGLGLILVQFSLFFFIVKSYNFVNLTKFQLNLFYILIISSLLLSGSRNGMISILLFLLLIRVFKIHFLFGILVLMSSFYFFNLISLDPVTIVKSLGLEDYFRVQTLESGSGRFIAWDFAWQQIQDYFYFGGGFGQDEQIMRPNYRMLALLGHQGGVHNSYLSLWMDTGIIGLVLYFSALITLIWSAAKNSKLAWPFFFTILFNINYESWLVGSLNPYTSLFLCSLTLLVMKDKFVNVELLSRDAQSSDTKIAQG